MRFFLSPLNPKKISTPLVLICDEKILNAEIKRYNFKKKIEIINYDKVFQKKFVNKKIYLINIRYKKSKNYVKTCFELAFKLIKKRFIK